MSSEARHIEMRWNARAVPPRWVVRVGLVWRDVIDEWAAESRHRGLARPHLEACARATYAHHAGIAWHEALQMWVTALYEQE